MAYQTVIFDMDGTLLDTLQDLADGVNHMLTQFHYPPRTVKEVGNFVGNGVQQLIRLAVPKDAGDEKLAQCQSVFKEYYAAHMKDKTRPYDGILELLAALRAEQIKTAVLSNKFDTAVKNLNEEYFAGLIGLAVGESSSVRKKPSPDGIFAILKELNASPEETLYVGDSEVDVQTAKNAGLFCVGVTWGFREKNVLEREGADVIIDRPEELLAIVRGA